MRIFILLIVLCFIAQAQKRFNADYFISKYNLNIPKVTKEMLDVSELTNIVDFCEYFYHRNTEKLDSVTRKLTMKGFEPNRRVQSYIYNFNSVTVKEVSVSLINGDTLNEWIKFIRNKLRDTTILNLKIKSVWITSYDKHGIKSVEAIKYPGEIDFVWKFFDNTKHDEYIESLRYIKGEIDSNSIMRYYFSPFKSIVAEFEVKKGKGPSISRLNIYNNKKKIQYRFSFFSNEVYKFSYYTYTEKRQIHREYIFIIKERDAEDISFEPGSYTEYEYDNLGRVIRETTRVKPNEPDTEFIQLTFDDSTNQAPVKITSISWEHANPNLRKDSAAVAKIGDTIELRAQIENCTEGTNVNFYIFGTIKGAGIHLTSLTTRCKNGTATVKWVTNTFYCKIIFTGLQFQCEVMNQRSPRTKIESILEPLGGFCIYIFDNYNRYITNAHVSILADSIEVFSGIVSDGILEIKELPPTDLIAKIQVDGRSISQPIQFICSSPPYTPQIITIDIDSNERELE